MIDEVQASVWQPMVAHRRVWNVDLAAAVRQPCNQESQCFGTEAVKINFSGREVITIQTDKALRQTGDSVVHRYATRNVVLEPVTDRYT